MNNKKKGLHYGLNRLKDYTGENPESVKSQNPRKSVILTKNATFPKYPSYKDSGVEWLGEIPEGWEVSRLRNVFSFSKGLTITKENLQEKGIYCVNYGEIHSKFGFEINPAIHELKCVSEEYLISDSNSLLSKGDFVFADTSEDIEGSGNFTYLSNEIKTFAGYHTVIARLKMPVNERFAAYVITSQSFRNQVRRRVKGVKVFSITQSLLKTVNFWFPSPQEQTRIAQFLDDKTTKIDRAIAQKEQLIALLKERKQIVIQHAVTKGLNQDVQDERMNRIDGATTKNPEIQKSSKSRFRQMKDSGVEWIGEIPVEWEVKALKYIAYLESGQTISSESFVEEGYPVYGGNGFRGYSANYTNEGKFALIGRQGALCGNVNYAEGKFFASEHAIVVYHKKDVNVLWLGEAIKAADFNRLSQSAAQPGIAVNVIKNVLFPFPSFEEQNKIASYIQTQSAKIDRAIALQQTQIEKLKEYKATLIDSAVRGKICVI